MLKLINVAKSEQNKFLESLNPYHLSQPTCRGKQTRSGGVCDSVCTHDRMLGNQPPEPVAVHACHDPFYHSNGKTREGPGLGD